MKKLSFLFLTVFIMACGADPAQDVVGTYNGQFSWVGVGNGEMQVSLTALSDNMLRLNMAAAGVPPIMVNGVGVNEQTQGNYGLTFSNQIYTLAGAIDETNHMTFQYTGDTISMTFAGVRQ